MRHLFLIALILSLTGCPPLNKGRRGKPIPRYNEHVELVRCP